MIPTLEDLLEQYRIAVSNHVLSDHGGTYAQEEVARIKADIIKYYA